MAGGKYVITFSTEGKNKEPADIQVEVVVE
jgi:hypothetical protein